MHACGPRGLEILPPSLCRVAYHAEADLPVRGSPLPLHAEAWKTGREPERWRRIVASTRDSACSLSRSVPTAAHLNLIALARCRATTQQPTTRVARTRRRSPIPSAIAIARRTRAAAFDPALTKPQAAPHMRALLLGSCGQWNVCRPGSRAGMCRSARHRHARVRRTRPGEGFRSVPRWPPLSCHLASSRSTLYGCDLWTGVALSYQKKKHSSVLLHKLS